MRNHWPGRALASTLSVGTLAAALTLSGCQKPEPTVHPEPLVGVLVPLSGPAAAKGQALLQGTQLAMGHLEADQQEADDPIGIIPADSMGTPLGAVEAFDRLVDEANVSIVIGALRPSVVDAVAARAASRGVTLLTPIPQAAGTAQASSTYHLRAGVGHDHRFLDALFASRLDLEQVALLDVGGPTDGDPGSDEAYALLRAAIERAGRALITTEVPPAAGPTMPLVALAQSRPDAVILVGSFAQIATYRGPAAELELELLAFTTDADEALFHRPPDEPRTTTHLAAVETAAGPTNDVGQGLSRVDEPATLPRYRRLPGGSSRLLDQLVDEFTAAYSKPPDAWAAYGYDLLLLAAHALRQHDGTAAGIANALDHTVRFVGVTGLLTFSAERQAHRVLRLVAEPNDGPPPVPRLPVWVLGSITPPVPAALPGTETMPEAASVTAADEADATTVAPDTDDRGSDPGLPEDLGSSDGASAEAPASPASATPAPSASDADSDTNALLANTTIVIVDFAEPAGDRAQALGQQLSPHVAKVIMASPSSIASVAALNTAHLYRRENTEAGATMAARIAEITGLPTTQHPDIRTGLDAVRRIIETYPNAGYFLIVN